MLDRHVREQIDIVERGLARAGRLQRAVPLTYILWGLLGTVFNAAYLPVPWIVAHRDGLFTFGDALTIVAIAATWIEYWITTRDRRTALDGQGLLIFGVVTNVLWIVKGPLLADGAVSGLAYAFTYTLGIAIALVVHGAGPLRPLMYGGVLLLGCVIFAALHPAFASAAFAAGNYCGLVIPGVYLAFVGGERGRG